MRVRITIETKRQGELTFELAGDEHEMIGREDEALQALSSRLGETVAAARRAYQLDGPEVETARLQAAIDEVSRHARQRAEQYGPHHPSIKPAELGDWLSGAWL